MDQAMSEPARNRFALDLEDLERQLRGAAQNPKPGHAADPLAELTRIVGQDDPLKDLFAQRAQPARPQGNGAQIVAPAWQQPRQEPSFAPTPVAHAPEPAPPAEIRGALDEFEALLRRTEPAAAQPRPTEAELAAREYQAPEPEAYQRRAPAPDTTHAARDLDADTASYAYGYDEPEGRYQAEPASIAEEDMPDLEPRRSYKGLWTAAALLAVGVIGVGAAVSFRSATPGSNGQPLVISADNGPTKIVPINPGGAEIPNQNKQIYERSTSQAQPAPTKIVSSSEQPVDVQQAARAMPPRVVLPGPGTAGSNSADGATNPLAQAPAAPATIATAAEPALTPVPPVPGLGEPRRVRTVSIRPDGTPAGANGNAGAVNAPPLVTGSAPARPSLPAMAMPNPTTPADTPRPTPPKVQERVVAPVTTPTPPVRIASAPAAAPAAPAPSTAAIRSGTGDFTVQLAAPGSEAEARATFSALLRKYPEQLRGQTPIVRKTDLAGGKTVFRLRVGPYSRDDATTMCSALQTAGGQCFISKN